MNKDEFLCALERELMVLPLEERLSALQYYRDYFDDAGKDKEASVINELGSPQKVAADILKEYRDLSPDVKSPKAPPESAAFRRPAAKGRGWLLVALGLLFFPVVLPLLATVFGLLVAVAAVVLAFFAVILILAIAFFFAGVILLIKGILSLVLSPVSAVFLGGVGLMLIALGIFSGVLFARMCMSLLPAMLRWFVSMCRRPFACRNGGRA